MDRPFIVIAGASGVVGKYLIKAAKDRYHIKILTRKLSGMEPKASQAIVWNPQAAKSNDQGELERLAKALSGARALINLAGSSISEGRFDARHKAQVVDSRLDSTTTLLRAFELANEPPSMWFQASAVGYYGNRGDEELREHSSPQAGFFLSDTAIAWEAAAQAVSTKTRLVIGRLGIVLAKDAKAWQQMLLPIKLFIGGPLGSGKQWYAWIHADDLAKALLYLIANSSSQGVYNLVAPEPVRQHDLAKTAAAPLARPSFVPAPAFALRLALGGLADMLLLPSAKVLPERLLAEDFTFDYPDIKTAMPSLI